MSEDIHLRKAENLPEHDYCSAIVVVKINPFGHLPSRNGQQNSTSTIVTCLAWDKQAYKGHRQDVLCDSSRGQYSSHSRRASQRR
jgi:hypothetical protein